jgi:ferritin-like metal-binding protein YciE
VPENGNKGKEVVQKYVGDIVALEAHIEEALDRQLKDATDNREAHAAIQRFHDMVKHNRDHMRQHMEAIGGEKGTNPIKAAGSAVLGAAAGVIDMVRSEGISKELRDNYTAFNLAAISYTMLHTTALGVGDQQTATICEEHLRNYARAIQEINHITPGVVAWELQKDGVPVAPQAASRTTEVVDRAWSDTSHTTGMSGSSGMSQQMPG